MPLGNFLVSFVVNKVSSLLRWRSVFGRSYTLTVVIPVSPVLVALLRGCPKSDPAGGGPYTTGVPKFGHF